MGKSTDDMGLCIQISRGGESSGGVSGIMTYQGISERQPFYITFNVGLKQWVVSSAWWFSLPICRGMAPHVKEEGTHQGRNKLWPASRTLGTPSVIILDIRYVIRYIDWQSTHCCNITSINGDQKQRNWITYKDMLAKASQNHVQKMPYTHLKVYPIAL